MSKFTKMRNIIYDHLETKGTYESVDDYFVEILADNLEMASALKTDLETEGIIITTSNGNGFATTKQNPKFVAYNQCLSIIFQTSVRLGISRKERMSLKILDEKKSDGFDEDFN